MTPDLRACEVELDDADELVWRQIHPRFLDGAVVLADGFVGPQPETAEVSVFRSSRRSSAEAHRYRCADH